MNHDEILKSLEKTLGGPANLAEFVKMQYAVCAMHSLVLLTSEKLNKAKSIEDCTPFKINFNVSQMAFHAYTMREGKIPLRDIKKAFKSAVLDLKRKGLFFEAEDGRYFPQQPCMDIAMKYHLNTFPDVPFVNTDESENLPIEEIVDVWSDIKNDPRVIDDIISFTKKAMNMKSSEGMSDKTGSN